ncbi:MAG: alpha/beta hydrolase [Myxococcota bacterium]
MSAAEVLPDKSTTVRLRPVRVPAWFRGSLRVASVLAPPLADEWLRRAFFTPQLARVRPEEARMLATGARFEVETLVGRVVARSWGRGPVVLLVHGWGGHAGQMSAWVEPLVAAGFQAVAADMPAHGESEGKLSNVLQFKNALLALGGQLGPLAGVVAHSFGAAGVMHALAGGLRVKRVVLVAAPASFESFWLRFREGTGISPAQWERFVRRSEAWLRVRFEDVQPGKLAVGMSAPLLLLHDEADGEVAFGEGVELARKWPGATLHATRGLGHLRILRDPTVLERSVAFLSG